MSRSASTESTKSAPLVATLTLGCKLNQAETQQAARELQRRGCVTVDRPTPADAYLINTCTITHVADRKARRLIRMARRLSPDAPVIVTGCYAERAGAELSEQPGIQVVANVRKAEAAEAVFATLADVGPTSAIRTASVGRTRAFIKIQEGCDDVCAFCIVPRVRGRERAIPIDELVAEVQERVEEGFQEIVLTGTQPGAYGRDRSDGTTAARLIDALLSRTDAARIRYSSIQPQDITPELLSCWDDARMCRHVHLALQSGSDAVLTRMRRRYSADQFIEAVTAFRLAVPGVSVTTDIIAGFPGETDDDHAATLALMRKVRFTDVHVFPYSSRSGTSAALLSDDVPPEVKRTRAAELRALGERHRGGALESEVGSLQSVLFETPGTGLTDTYLPCRVETDDDLSNQLRSVRVAAVDDSGLVGELV
ncbi:MAG: tRNA (N(6)-L-threonylcarbamoyladenosine(37)-C(2))-methylthiotransferase MtaB [Chloroflexi bacterium]|nr:tRNA (N(6)-L-threonylcarbamoyladenosine(37)-C(2))-methylthiotransferase MtaB [Chloroflexota bacterium]MCY3696273.1 tRNA (N(6)-L-threonylcarbamoyladenosine(37)-C(2))-methylthiotransferase MtaB [Chloroflexota bacterium]